MQGMKKGAKKGLKKGPKKVPVKVVPPHGVESVHAEPVEDEEIDVVYH